MEAAIIFYAGWLGHYVGDGSQPLHVTVNYNGWTGPNPHGYTTDIKSTASSRDRLSGPTSTRPRCRPK